MGRAMNLRSFAAAVAVVGAAVLAASCTRADYIEISPNVATLKSKYSEVLLSARAKGHNGREFPNISVGWSIKDPSIAAITQDGKVTPLKSGRTEAVASYGGIFAAVPVEVLFVEKLKVEPASLELVADGDPVDLKARVYDYTGRELKDRSAAYKSQDGTIASMGQNAVHPGSPGATKIEVRVDEQVQFVDVVVKKRK